MTKLTITSGKAESEKSVPFAIRMQMEGRKADLKNGGIRFEATQHNISLFLSVHPETEVIDFDAFIEETVQKRGEFAFKTKPYPHQMEAFMKLKTQHAFALLLEQGLGKTKTLCDIAAYKYCEGEIDALIILSPKGVHFQWIEEQLPDHMAVTWKGWAWQKGKKAAEEYEKTASFDGLRCVAMNVDAVKTKDGLALLQDFIHRNSGRVLLCVDEAHLIKNSRSQRTKQIIEIGASCVDRAILTGTPVSRQIDDLFSQYKFLDENIIGCKYYTTFRNQYCLTRNNGFGIEVIGARDLEKLYAKIDPNTFRATKEELDLPEKIYDKRYFEMTPEQEKHYQELKNLFLTEIDSGEIVTVTNAASMIVKLQQITCGFLHTEDDEYLEFANPRLDALKEILTDNQTIIWARFNRDIEAIKKALGDDCVAYYGKTKPKEREEAKTRFLSGDVKYFVANPAAAGTGLNLQGLCTTAIYYSNSYNALDRWQSEDRIHRIGTKGACTYIDLICRKAVDGKILTNLRGKKSLSDLALDEIRKMVAE